MKKVKLLILAFFLGTSVFAQIAEKDFDKSEKLENRTAEIIDSTKILTKNSSLIYSHNSLFRCIHLKGTHNKLFLIDVVYLDDYAGYTEFKKDCDEKVMFEVRCDGSGNEPFLMIIDKTTGKKKFVDEKN